MLKRIAYTHKQVHLYHKFIKIYKFLCLIIHISFNYFQLKKIMYVFNLMHLSNYISKEEDEATLDECLNVSFTWNIYLTFKCNNLMCLLRLLYIVIILIADITVVLWFK